MNAIVAATKASSAPSAAQSFTPVHAPLSFIRPQLSKPCFHSSALTGGAPRMFFETEERVVAISDMRPLAADLSLDREGFALLRHEIAVEDLYDDAAVDQIYFREVEALLMQQFGARRVVVFDATRRSDDGAGARNRDGLRGPATRVHVDYTVKSGPQRARNFLDRAELARVAAGKSRIVQVNVWRPIRGPVMRAPLAVADASTVRPEDLIATDQVFPDRVGEIYHLAYDAAQRWYFAPSMTPDEVLLIKGWDSLDDGRARFTPHSAFELPKTPGAVPARESIEVRTFVIIG